MSKVGIQDVTMRHGFWIPAKAGMTEMIKNRTYDKEPRLFERGSQEEFSFI
jgi:hypothetical protein